MYIAVKHIHLTLVLISLSLLVYRFISHQIKAKPLPKLLKIAPHVIDTFLLISAVVLCVIIQQYPIIDNWLTLKVGFVIGYIVAAVFAMKLQTKWQSVSAFILATLCVIMAAKVAVLKLSF